MRKLARWGDKEVFLSVATDVSELKRTEQALREREARLRGILDASSESVFLIDREGIVLECNETTAGRLGKTIDELLGKPIYGFLPPDLAQSRRREVQKALQSRKPVQFEDRRDGVCFEHTVYPVFDDAGEVVECAIFGRDISARKRAEEQLLLQSLVLDQIQDRVTVTDLQGVITYVNDAECLTLKRSRESLIGQHVLIYGEEPGRGAAQLDIIRATLADGEWRGDVVNYASDGSERVIDCRTRLVKDRDGQPVAMCGIGTDITERRRAEESLSESEERLRLATKATNDVIWDWDIVHDSQRWNDAGTAVFGWSDIVEHPQTAQWWLQRVHPDDRSRVDDGFGAVFASRDRCHWQDEYRFLKADGTYAFVLDRGYVMRDEQGKAVRMIGAMLDLTGRKQAEESLRQSEEHYRVLAETMLQGVVHQDQDGTIISMNPAAERILGKNRDQFLGSSSVEEEPFTIREDGSPFPGLEHPAMVALRTGQPLRGAVMGVFNPKVNAHRWISVDAVPLFRPGEKHPYQVYTVFEDITERKQMEQQNLEMERRLLHAQKLESLGILAGGIAHDFNNILAGIMGYADLLKVRLPSSEPAREDVDIIKRAAQRAADLTQQMLAYSGKGKFVIEALDLSRIVADTRKMLEVSVSKKATLTCNLAPSPPTIEADSAQVHQVILNLVINASEALGENSGVIAIMTHAVHLSEIEWAAVRTGSEASAGHYVCLEVADTGCGMSRETLGKIFDPFFTTKFTGRGLGLAAVHGIVLGHKGGLRVTSEPGTGTTFQVYFPASTVAAPTSRVEAGTSSWRGSGTVLVVDDEEIVRSTAKRMLEHAGFSVLTADDGQEAIHVYRRHQSEIMCVLLDLTMPTMDGEETMRELRTINPNICVILSSGFSEDNATERFLDLGLREFIQKPYELDAMTNTLRRALANSEKGRSASVDADTPGASSSPSRSTSLALACSESEQRRTRQDSGTVLVVDDDAMSRISTQILLEQAGFSVLTANDGEEAVTVFGAHRDRIVCVFLDLNLPKMNGADALRAIRQMERQVHAIVTSGCDADTMKRRCAGLEVLEFVPKPTPLDTAIERLQAAARARLRSV
jgi:two-component system, cell cycle sensor histidine kinase and response regulator CckA